MKPTLKVITYLTPTDDLGTKQQAAESARIRRRTVEQALPCWRVEAVPFNKQKYLQYLDGKEDTRTARSQWAAMQPGERVTPQNLDRLFPA